LKVNEQSEKESKGGPREPGEMSNESESLTDAQANAASAELSSEERTKLEE
jgi:hypothetical protein